MKKAPRIAIVIAVVLGAAALALGFAPTGRRTSPPAGFQPLRDESLARRFLPGFDCPPEYGPIIAVYYRAARDQAGVLRIAYHPVWASERNSGKGIGPFMSRILYTGGLSLQRLMYGKGDIESLGLVLDAAGETVVQVEYETAADYRPSDFGVKHRKVIARGPFAPPLRFKVVSWNHLFELEKAEPVAPAAGAPQAAAATSTGPGAAPASSPPLSYFDPELWKAYAMWKNPETILRKDRAHFEWERGAAP